MVSGPQTRPIKKNKKIRSRSINRESEEGLWLQGEAALQLQSFRDAEPPPVIQPYEKKNHVERFSVSRIPDFFCRYSEYLIIDMPKSLDVKHAIIII